MILSRARDIGYISNWWPTVLKRRNQQCRAMCKWMATWQMYYQLKTSSIWANKGSLLNHRCFSKSLCQSRVSVWSGLSRHLVWDRRSRTATLTLRVLGKVVTLNLKSTLLVGSRVWALRVSHVGRTERYSSFRLRKGSRGRILSRLRTTVTSRSKCGWRRERSWQVRSLWDRGAHREGAVVTSRRMLDFWRRLS